MMVFEYTSLTLDDELPTLTMPPITRQMLAIYCGASGDHNPIHVDIDFAQESGLDDVIAHGMLIMAYMGRLVRACETQERLLSTSATPVPLSTEICEYTANQMAKRADNQPIGYTDWQAAFRRQIRQDPSFMA